MPKRGYKIKDICAMLDYSRSTVYGLIKAKKLLTYGSGSGLRVRADSLEAFIAGGAQWEPSEKLAAAKVRGPTDMTKRRSSIATASGTRDATTPSLTLIDRGRKLHLNS
jgi:excisionase family DNA binding protein